MVVDVLRYYAGLATKIHGETVNTLETAFTYTLARTCGRGGYDRSVEFSAAAGFVEAWSSAGLWQHDRVEAGQPDFVDHVAIRKAGDGSGCSCGRY